jgi:Leucine-rich repeat (LRR) protein
MRVNVSYNHGKYKYYERIPLSSVIDITGMYCIPNKLRVLPYMPNIRILNCRENKIKYLPYLPNILDLSCYKNKIKDYSNLPRKSCENNKYLYYLYLNVHF